MSDKGYNLDPGILEDHKWLIAESNYQVILASHIRTYIFC